ncbi:MAG: DNA-binding transcriptional regulator Fis [Gammaproteobacteria bacterium]|nr:DNA-binding transcriptional regulator Fis [Gammaproteobacteria bacterium]
MENCCMKQAAKQIPPLNKCVREALEEYFERLDGQKVTNLYDMVLKEVETPLLKTVMKHTKNNQSNASNLLGMNRGTLRKKLKQYKLEIKQ